MAESPEKRLPKFGFSPGGYLPRLWRAEPEPPTETDPARGKKKKGGGSTTAKGKGKKAKSNDETEVKKGVLLEETPGLDTYEARRTVRLIAGTVGTLLLLLVGFVVYRVIFRSPVEEDRFSIETVIVEDSRILKARHETEARTMIDRAREVARTGNKGLALSLLSRLSTAYPETKAAALAREVLSRPQQYLPLFVESREVTIKGENPPPNQEGPDPSRVSTVPGVENPATPATQASTPAATTPGTVDPAPSSNPPLPVAVASSRPLPNGYQARAGIGMHPSGWPLEIFGGRDGSIMVLVPGGIFVMGRDGGDAAEAPAHQVRVSPFYIDKHEVTKRQFDRFVQEKGPRPDRARALAREGGSVSFSDDSPVVMVDTKDASDYAEWAGKGIPTEAQWELAARGIDNRYYPWGPLPPVWERRREPRQIDAVMSFPSDSSPFGVYDMAGNALEWTRDWFDPAYYTSFGSALAEDPTGPTTVPPNSFVTVKGGSNQWIVSARQGIKFDSRLPYLGFRCVLPLEGPAHVFQPAAPAPPIQRIAPFPPSQRNPRKKAFVPF